MPLQPDSSQSRVARSVQYSSVEDRMGTVMSFGRRTAQPIRKRTPLAASPDLLAYALERTAEGSLREAVLRQLYMRLTPAEQRRCAAGMRLLPLAYAS